ncbi:UNVERIFIED_CONTAM: hypothetical protein FKN15_047861 [Acipenser sinensis]
MYPKDRLTWPRIENEREQRGFVKMCARSERPRTRGAEQTNHLSCPHHFEFV